MVDMMGRQKAQKQQQQNLDNWYMYQALQRNQEMMRQNALGIEANNARMTGLNDVGSLGQKATQSAEAVRLNDHLQRGTSAAATPASDASIGANTQQGMLTGQSGGDREFKSDLARRLNNRTQDAKGRIQALATMGSYGDSMGGLGTMNPLNFQKAGWGINQANNFRRGSLQAYGVEKQIQPQQVQYQGSPLAMGLQSIGGLMSGMGKGGGGGGGMF
jgi:hypothetical protein